MGCGSAQRKIAGYGNGIISKLKLDISQVIQSTYLGDSQWDQIMPLR